MRISFSGWLIFFVIVCVVAVPHAGASILAGPVVDPSNGNTYYLLNQTTWTNSETQAVGLGGHLATVANQTENDWILSTFGPYTANNAQDLWLGFYDPVGVNRDDGPGGQGTTHSGDFVWSSGSPVTFTNWAAAQPDDDPVWGGEYYAVMQTHQYLNTLAPGSWNDGNNAASGAIAFGVVEVVPEPAPLGFLAVAAMTHLSRRCRRRQSTMERIDAR